MKLKLIEKVAYICTVTENNL